MSMWLDTLYFFRDCAIRGPVRAPGLSPGKWLRRRCVPVKP